MDKYLLAKSTREVVGSLLDLMFRKVLKKKKKKAYD